VILNVSKESIIICVILYYWTSDRVKEWISFVILLHKIVLLSLVLLLILPIMMVMMMVMTMIMMMMMLIIIIIIMIILVYHKP
jgi:hypothetical protein